MLIFTYIRANSVVLKNPIILNIMHDIFILRNTEVVLLVEQKLLTLPVHMSSLPVLQWGSCYSMLSLMCNVCRSLLVLLYIVSVLQTLLVIYMIIDVISLNYKIFYSQTSQLFHLSSITSFTCYKCLSTGNVTRRSIVLLISFFFCQMVN